MTSPLGKLLTVGALCWVAPLGAEPRSSDVETWIDEPSCPEEIAKRAEAQQSIVRSDSALLQHSRQAATMLP